MANLPETETYDEGVYQLEITDAVVGGVNGKSNAAQINLANRTKYLKAHVDAMEVIVEQAEAEAGASTTLRGWNALRVRQAIAAAITALVVQATETIKGIAKIATQAQTDAGTDDETIVTPKKMRFGFTYSFSPTYGYIVAPSWLCGITLQMGSEVRTGTSYSTITYPIAYPHACLIRHAYNSDEGVDDHTEVTNLNMVIYDVLNPTSFDWVCMTADTGTPTPPANFSWFSVGY